MFCCYGDSREKMFHEWCCEQLGCDVAYTAARCRDFAYRIVVLGYGTTCHWEPEKIEQLIRMLSRMHGEIYKDALGAAIHMQQNRPTLLRSNYLVKKQMLRLSTVTCDDYDTQVEADTSGFLALVF